MYTEASILFEQSVRKLESSLLGGQPSTDSHGRSRTRTENRSADDCPCPPDMSVMSVDKPDVSVIKNKKKVALAAK